MSGKYKTIEDVRKATGQSQKVFADTIGTTFRTYQARLKGDQPKWLLSEIIKASEYNNGYIIVPKPQGSYKVHIEKVQE